MHAHDYLHDLDLWMDEQEAFTSPDPARRDALLTAAFAYHASQSEALKLYADSATPRTELGFPLVPVEVFKTGAFQQPQLSDLYHTRSSGTSGVASIVPRDEASLLRFYGGMHALVRGVVGIERPDLRVLNLGPSLRDTNDVWISYVMAGLGLFHESTNFFENGELDLDALHLHMSEARHGPTVIVSPPFILADLLDQHALPRWTQDAPLWVLTVGGWKRRVGDAIEKHQLRCELATAFDIPQSQIRDTYNMVELNTAMVECACGTFRIPPWLWVESVDPRDLSPSQDDHGVLAFADPSATGYPCFILSEDVGRVIRDHRCECGLRGDVVQLERRLRKTESRGCALRLDKKEQA